MLKFNQKEHFLIFSNTKYQGSNTFFAVLIQNFLYVTVTNFSLSHSHVKNKLRYKFVSNSRCHYKYYIDIEFQANIAEYGSLIELD